MHRSTPVNTFWKRSGALGRSAPSAAYREESAAIKNSWASCCSYPAKYSADDHIACMKACGEYGVSLPEKHCVKSWSSSHAMHGRRVVAEEPSILEPPAFTGDCRLRAMHSKRL